MDSASPAAAVPSSLQKFKAVERVLDVVSPVEDVTHGETPTGERPRFDFLSLRGEAPPALDLSLARAAANNRPFSHDEAAAQDAATIAINADRILREAHDRLEAERAAEFKARKKERKVRYVMGDNDPLIKACKKGEDERVRELVASQDPEEVRDYVNSRDKNGSTPIMHTVWPGHLEALRLLLEHGADPNIQNNRQNTALHLACEQEHHELIVTLIQFGASITLLNLNNQTCYMTLSDPVARNKMENFTKRTFNDVRRGHMGTAQYRLPKAPKRAEFWSTEYYQKDYFNDVMREDVKQVAANLPSTSELKRALEPVSHALQTNATGVPDVGTFFYDFIDVSLAKDLATSTKARMERLKQQKKVLREATEAAAAVGTEEESEIGQLRKRTRRSATTFIRPDSSPTSARKKRRRKSTGDMHLTPTHTPSVQATLAQLRLYCDLDIRQEQLVQFWTLMHPHKIPIPPPFTNIPRWLEQYCQLRKKERLELENLERERREEERPKLKEGHEYALTRMRTAAFAGATSPIFNATLMSSTRTEIPHAHQPNLVRPTVKLLKDLTLHLPVTPIKLPNSGTTTNIGGRPHTSSTDLNASSRSATKSSSTFIPHLSTRSRVGQIDSWDATSIALDREQASNLRKNPSYGNWVLRQLSVLQELEGVVNKNGAGTTSSSSSSNPHHFHDPSPRTLESLDRRHSEMVRRDEEHMRIQDPELRGLIDTEVESFLQRKYGGTMKQQQQQESKSKDPLDAYERDSLAPSTSTTSLHASRSNIDLLAPSASAARLPMSFSGLGGGGSASTPAGVAAAASAAGTSSTRSSPPPGGMEYLAHEYLVDEKESYLQNLYVQISSTLVRLKKSGLLYIPPDLSRKMKRLNPSLLDVLSPSSSVSHSTSVRLDTGGVRPEFATLGYDTTTTQGLAHSFENQVRELIQQRRIEREMTLGQGQHMQQQPSTHLPPATPSNSFLSPASSNVSSSIPSTPQQHVTPLIGGHQRSASAVNIDTPNINNTNKKTMARSGSAKLISPTKGTKSSTDGVSTSLTPSSSESALNSAAMQRALIAQYNPRALSPFVGGGSYERRGALTPVGIRLNTAAKIMTTPTSAAGEYEESSYLDSSHDHTGEPQVMEIHSSNYNTYRSGLNSSHGYRPGTSSGVSRPMTSTSRPRTGDGSIAMQQLTMPSVDIPMNPIVMIGGVGGGSPTRVRSAVRTKHLSSSPPPLGSTPSYAELNPTRRPSLIGHSNAIRRPEHLATRTPNDTLRTRSPSVSKLPSATQQQHTRSASLTSSPATNGGMKKSASMTHIRSSSSSTTNHFGGGSYPSEFGQTHASPSPSSSPSSSPTTVPTSSVTPIFSAPSAVAFVHPSSMSARISNIVSPASFQGVGASSGSVGDPADTTGLLKKIKQQSHSHSPHFRTVGRVYEGRPGVVTVGSPPPVTPATKQRAQAGGNRFEQTTPVSTHANAFGVGIPTPHVDHVEEEKEHSLSSSPSSTTILHGSSPSFSNDSSLASSAVGSLAGSKLQLSSKHAASRVLLNELEGDDGVVEPSASSSSRVSHRHPTDPLVILVSPSSRPTSPMSPTSRAAVNKEKAIKKRLAHGVKEAQHVTIDPDWHPHPAMDSGVNQAYRTQLSSDSSLTGWDASDDSRRLGGLVVSPTRATVVRQAASFASLQRPNAQLGLIAATTPNKGK